MSSYEYYYAGEELLAILGGLFSGLPSVAFRIAAYILTALALYTVARRRGIHKPWLAWIPVADVWLLGSISDQYRYVVKGEVKSKRKILLTLRIILSALCVAVVAAVMVMAFNAIGSVMYYSGQKQIWEAMFGMLGTVLGLALPLIGVSIAYTIVYFMALYDVYTSMDPENSVLFLVLSILIPVTKPFFLFFNRNKDRGMPPRRDAPTYAPAQDPWETEDRNYL